MIKTIPSRQLRPGMFLHRLCGSWLHHPFWRTSFLIKDARQIAEIVDSGIAEVMIDLSRGLDVACDDGGAMPDDGADTAEAAAGDTPAVGMPEADDPAPPVDADIDAARAAPDGPSGAAAGSPIVLTHKGLGAEIVRARRILADGKEKVARMFGDVRLGKVVDASAALPLVDEIASSVMRNPGALISVARLKHKDDYTYLHSVAVCALMVALARELGLDEERTRQAGYGGLMHDLGKAMMPLDVLNKPGRLTDDEFVTMKRHPEAGHRLLVEGGAVGEEVLDIALHHHEKFDGSGYPHGLAGEDISLLARMGAVCDVYDAITSNRPYKAAWDPGESVQRMAGWKGHFDTAVLKAFIKSVGIYPIGALVKLESERLGVVVGRGEASLLKPRLKVFYSVRRRMQIPVHEIDLESPGCQDRIVGVESPDNWGFVNLEQLWMP